LDLSNIHKLESFNFISTWGTENGLAEKRLESTGLIMVVTFLGGQKLVNTCSVVGGQIIAQQEKNLESKTQLDEPVESASGGDPLLIYKILHLLFFPLVRILCALRLESRKNYQHGLDAGPLEFQILRPRGCLTNPFKTLSLSFGVIDKTPKHQFSSPIIILLKKFLSASAIAIISWQDVTRSSLCSGVKECGTKCAHNFLFPKSSFRIQKTVLGMLKNSAIILSVIRRSF
jgi:hypothetical protein